ncbi:unnamed protein product [Cylindrotheca closterium]|uniref:Uncharacterized protein n=1 Tax=Cylindrotheca closterium TaxID=2856 RepID=A0AAD2G5F3_9STRA|nr:unnamed protein product [Cylindrotheca closterium]
MEFKSCATFSSAIGVSEIGTIGPQDGITPLAVCTHRTTSTSNFVTASCPSDTVLVVTERGGKEWAPTAQEGRPLTGFGLPQPLAYFDVTSTWPDTIDVLLPSDVGCVLGDGSACCCCSDVPEDCVREDGSCRNTRGVIEEVCNGAQTDRCFFNSPVRSSSPPGNRGSSPGSGGDLVCEAKTPKSAPWSADWLLAWIVTSGMSLMALVGAFKKTAFDRLLEAIGIRLDHKLDQITDSMAIDVPAEAAMAQATAIPEARAEVEMQRVSK